MKSERESRNIRVVEGTAARQLQPVRRRDTQQPDRVRRGNISTAPEKRKQESLSGIYAIFLGSLCVLTFFVGAMYLQEQELSTANRKQIAQLESDLSKIEKENDDNINRINASINLEQIKDIAINELGMVYATQDNVITYEDDSKDYVNQYKEVESEP